MQTFRKRRAGLSATAGLSCCNTLHCTAKYEMYSTGGNTKPQQPTEMSFEDDDRLRTSSTSAVVGSAESVRMLQTEAVDDVAVQSSQQAITAAQSSSSKCETITPPKSSVKKLSPKSGVSVILADNGAKQSVILVTRASRSQSSDVTVVSYESATGASPSITQSLSAAASKSVNLPHTKDSFTTAAVEHDRQSGVCVTATDFDKQKSRRIVSFEDSEKRQSTMTDDEKARKSRSELASSPPGALQKSTAARSHVSTALDDVDACASTAASNQTLDAKRSESRQLTDEQSHSLPETLADTSSSALSYVTVTSTGDTCNPCLTTQISCATHQPDSTCRFSTPATLSSCMPTRSASKTDERGKKTCTMPGELASSTSSEVDALHITEATKPHDTKHVAFTTDDHDDEAETPVDRRPTPFAWDSPKDSSSEVDTDNVDLTTMVDWETPRSQPDIAYHPETLTSDESRSSLPPTIACNVAADVSAASSPAAVSDSSREVKHASLSSQCVGCVERKSVQISCHVSTFVPSLPGHETDDTRKDENFATAQTLPTTTIITPPTTDAERVSDAQISDTDTKEYEISTIGFDVPEGEDQENICPDVLPESLDEPLPMEYDSPTKSDEEDNEVENLEKQAAALSINVDHMRERMSTLEPQRLMPEIVYISMHEEKQVKDTDTEADAEKRDVRVETKTPLATYDRRIDDNRQKLATDLFAPAPPSVAEPGIVMTLSDFDLAEDNLLKKVGMLSVDQRNESLSNAKKTKVTPRFTGAAKTSKIAEKGKWTSVKNKTAAGDEFRQPSTSADTKIVKAGPLSNADVKKKLKPTFVEELIDESRRKASFRPSQKVTPGETPSADVNDVPERQHSSTLIFALNRDTECDDETGGYLHVASQPSSYSYRYIVSPDTQYAGGRSLSRSSIFQPLQCKQPSTTTAGIDKPKGQNGTASLTNSQAVGITSTKPTESSYTLLGSAGKPATGDLSASVSGDKNNRSLLHTLPLQATDHIEPSVRLPSQATKPSSLSSSVHHPIDQLPSQATDHTEPSVRLPSEVTKPSSLPSSVHRLTDQLTSAAEPAPTFVPRKPSVGQSIHITLADLDRDEEDVVGNARWLKSSIPHSGGNNQSRLTSQVSAAVKTNSPDVANTRQPSLLSLGLDQRNSPGHVISFTLDSYDTLDDRSLSYPVIIRGGSGGVTSQKVMFNTEPHYSDGEIVDEHYNEPVKPSVSSIQPTNSIDNVSTQNKTQDSHNLVSASPKTETRMSPEREHKETDSVHELSYPVGIRGGSGGATSQKVKFDTGSQYDGETVDKHYNAPVKPPVSSIQPTNSIDKVSTQTKQQASHNLVTASPMATTRMSPEREHKETKSVYELSCPATIRGCSGGSTSQKVKFDTGSQYDGEAKTRMSPEREHKETKSVDERNIVQVAAAIVTEAIELGVRETEAQFDNVNQSRMSGMTHSDYSDVGTVTPTLPQKSKIDKTQNIIVEEEFRSTTSKSVGGGKTKSSSRPNSLLMLFNRKKKNKSPNN